MTTPAILHLDAGQVEAYLTRLGTRRPPRADRDGLAALHEAHLFAVPFENLDIALGRPIELDVDRLVDKIAIQQRGGFCYELNGAFASLLGSLGYRVTLLEARVYDRGELGIRFDHLCLRIDLDEPWLCDVGFGDSFLRPLRLDAATAQRDRGRDYAVRATADGFDVLEDGEATYRGFGTPRALSEFAEACRYHQTSPASHFTRHTICSRPTATGRVTIRGRALITTVDGERSTRRIERDDELLALYRTEFGIALDRVPVR